MATTSPEGDLHAHAPMDGAELAQPDFGMDPPEHISMEDLSYVAHLIGNAIAAIKCCIDYEGNDPSIEEYLKQSKEITVNRINFLLTRYEQDLRNTPEIRDFLELLLYLVQNDQFKHACKLHQLGARAFKIGAPAKPGRHLSLEKPVILFVDDEEPLRSMFIEMMPKNLTDQIDFRIAADGTEALAIIGETRKMLIGLLTDLGLGSGTNGNAVAKAALDAGIMHVAICTGSEAEAICDDIRNRVTLVRKPFDMQQLLNFCNEAYDEHCRNYNSKR